MTALIGHEEEQLTLSETVNIMGVLVYALGRDYQGDSVLQSAWEKLRQQAHAYAEENPEEFHAVVDETAMRQRFWQGDV